MKKSIILIILISLSLTSCVSESKNCDIFKLSERINSQTNCELMKTDDLISDENNIIYWFPESNKNTCVSFYINKKTGNIEKCDIVFNDKKEDRKITEIIENALGYNNPYFTKKLFATEKYIAVHFEDTRYTEDKSDLTLKKDIIEEDLY